MIFEAKEKIKKEGNAVGLTREAYEKICEIERKTGLKKYKIASMIIMNTPIDYTYPDDEEQEEISIQEGSYD